MTLSPREQFIAALDSFDDARFNLSHDDGDHYQLTRLYDEARATVIAAYDAAHPTAAGEAVAMYSPCCKFIRWGVTSTSVLHNGSCRDRHGGELGPTVYLYTAPPTPAAAPEGWVTKLQQKCVDWGAYWRAPDDHGVKLTVEQAVELLRDVLGVEVEIAAAPKREGGEREFTVPEESKDTEAPCEYDGYQAAAWASGRNSMRAEVLRLSEEPKRDSGLDEPTERMVIAGFESDAWDALRTKVMERTKDGCWVYSCREAAECVRGIYKAMRAAMSREAQG